MITSTFRRMAAPALVFGLLLGPTIATAQPRRDPRIESRVEALLSRMTLDEKIGQLVLVSDNPDFDRREIANGRVGGVMGFGDAVAIQSVQDLARRSRLGIPLLVGLDVVHGLRTMFPLGLAEAASFDPSLARRTAEIAARDAASIGFNWTFAPSVDLARDPRWGRMIEGSGEDPTLGAAFARARVEGFRAGGLAVTLKHFAGYGAAEGGRDYDEVELSRADLLDRYLPPFRAGIEAGAESVMSAFHALNGMPATANRPLLTGILRERWGYDGFVVSDWDAIGQLRDHGIATNGAEAARKALLAGVDADMASGFYRTELAAEVKAGRIPGSAVTEAARRVLRAKMRMGLFERPPLANRSSEIPPPTAEGRAATRRAAQDTIVLLRNSGALPIAGAPAKIALIGGMADSGKDIVGPHAALVNYEDGVTVLKGLRDRAERAGATLSFSPGCDAFCVDESGFEAAVTTARDADLVVAILGEPEEMTGEGGSRAHLTLPGRQPELLRRLVDTGRPVVVVLLASRSIELGPIADRLAGLLMAWFPGTEGGNAVADILFGDADPSAKLPVSWPRTIGQVPLTYDRLPTGRPPDVRNRFTLRYSDEQLTPLYPFGFGLGYTSFAYSDLKLAAARITRNGVLDANVRLANTGARAGREVAQLYVRQMVGSVSRPLRQLKAFDKVALAPGESRVVTLRVPVSALGFHREDGTYVVEPGRYQVFVGGSSDAVLSAEFEVVR